ncbi:hypothetical protein EDC94DRAFT_526015 [Helicostylum pulchrum]|nr:hypothetical protein EDC94DRAFT_526015 [Helicostylum pulchrum]
MKQILLSKLSFQSESDNLARKICSNLFYDKCKAVLAEKCHLNYLIINTKYLPSKDTHTLFILIMGMGCHIYVLSLIDKGMSANVPTMFTSNLIQKTRNYKGTRTPKK